MLSSLPLLLAALGLLLLQLVSARSTGLAVRAVSAADMNTFRGAVLVKNGQPTSCEFALIDNQSAFLAANCLDFSNGQVNQNTKYEIYFDKAKGQGPGRATLIPDKIRVHPLYNPTSFANNIAVVEFNYSDQGTWINYISVNSLEWASVVNVRRQLLSPSAQSWGSPLVQSQTGNDPNCFKASALFKSNVRDMVCSVHSLSSPISNKCTVPYGALYGVSQNAMAISAIYSHTVVYNNNMCSGGQSYNYFTMLSNYTRYASSVLGRRVYEYIEKPDLYKTMWHTTSHHFQNEDAMNSAGTSQFGGDLYAEPEPEPQPEPQPQQSPNPGPKPSPSASNKPQPSKPTPTNNSDNHGGGSIGPGVSISNSDNGDDEFVLKPIDTSGLSDNPNSAVTLVDPADNESQSNGVIVSESSSSNDAFGDGDSGTGGNGTGGNGTGGNGTGGSGGNGHKPADGNNNNNNNGSGGNNSGNTGGLETSPDSGVKANGLPKKTIIALAVSIPILFLLLGVGLFFIYRNYKKRQADRKWSPGSSHLRNNMRVIMEEIGGASDSLNFPGPKEDVNKPTVYQFSHPLASKGT
ncbi:hypothetical protein GGH94_003112 [Coemansia aciculifera]|uniref:Peptidase S1 domain-containing protein n=1 Tax=Coemansia aciculifera TaxID=417176 RepID=A0A9W8M3E9_9FUNG|nr:hypothetical protein GGH94_003112 [Coemansia aciculifera]